MAVNESGVKRNYDINLCDHMTGRRGCGRGGSSDASI